MSSSESETSNDRELIQTVYQGLGTVEDKLREEIELVKNQQEEVLLEIEAIRNRLQHLEDEQ